MNALTIAQLDTQTADEIGTDVLIAAARLQVALNECEALLPENWELKLSVGSFGRMDMFTAVAGYCYSLRHYRRNVGKARSCPYEMAHGATYLAAVLALRDALATRP